MQKLICAHCGREIENGEIWHNGQVYGKTCYDFLMDKDMDKGRDKDRNER